MKIFPKLVVNDLKDVEHQELNCYEVQLQLTQNQYLMLLRALSEKRKRLFNTYQMYSHPMPRALNMVYAEKITELDNMISQCTSTKKD